MAIKRKQLFINIAANILSVMVSLIVSFFLTPFIVKNIGKEAYSFVPISNNFVQYMTILTIALTSMTSRFFTLSIHEGNFEKADQYYSSSFFASLVVASVAVFAGVFFIFNLEHVIDVPPTILFDVKLLFGFMFLMFFVNVTTNTFSVPAFSANRVDVTGVITICAIIARIVVIIVAFALFTPHVYYVGVSILAYMVVQGSLLIFSSRRIAPNLKISLRNVKMVAILELTKSGIWNAFNQLSSLLLTGLDLVLANMILGASAAGILAVAKTIPMALHMLVNVVPQSIHPHLTITYAKGNIENFIYELRSSMKLTALITGVPIAGFTVLSAAFFKLWVPSVDNQIVTILAILAMGSMLFSFGQITLLSVFTITNKLKTPAYVLFMSGIANLVLVLVLVNFTDLGIFAIAGISSGLEILRMTVFVPIYAAYCLKVRRSFFYPDVFRNFAYMASMITFNLVLIYFFKPTTWIHLVILAVLMTICGGLIGIFVLFNQEQRSSIIAKYPLLKKLLFLK